MTPSVPPITTAAGRRWQAMVEAHQEQSQRLRDPQWQPPSDFGRFNVESFRAGRVGGDDVAVVEALLPSLHPTDTFVDVGAGAGRFALPLAAHVREVIAIEPSPAMGAALSADVQRAGLTNVRLIASRWQEAGEVRGEVLFSSHTLYAFAEVEPLLRWMSAAAGRWSAILLFADSPLSWLAPFWPRVHGEARRPAPHFPQLLDVLEDLGLGPLETQMIAAEPFPLGSFEVARTKLRRRLFVVPDSAADARLAGAMQELLEERDGVLGVRGKPTIQLGLVRWGRER